MVTTGTTWAQALAEATTRLADAGIDEAEVDAALLLGHLVGASRTMVQLYRDRALTAEQADALDQLLTRRAAREPLPYVLGGQEFLGLPFASDARALVPRWDTEALAERAIAALRPHAEPRVADIGTGSGILAVSLAHELPAARVWAVDISPEALSLATENAGTLGVADRVECLLGHLLTPLPADLRLHGIIANLPYIPSGELAGLQPEVRDWEPSLALDGGADGLDLLRELIDTARDRLLPGGWLLLEHADDQSAAVQALLTAAGYSAVELIQDWSGRARGVLGVWQP